MFQVSCICLRLPMQWTAVALAFALERAGKSIPARMAMIAITTSSSMRVNARFPRGANEPDKSIFSISPLLLIAFCLSERIYGDFRVSSRVLRPKQFASRFSGPKLIPGSQGSRRRRPINAGWRLRCGKLIFVFQLAFEASKFDFQLRGDLFGSRFAVQVIQFVGIVNQVKKLPLLPG